MKKIKLFIFTAVGILFVGFVWNYSHSGIQIGDRYCSVNPQYSKDNPIIGTSIEINDIANGVAIYTVRLVVPDETDTAMRWMGYSGAVDGQKDSASLEKLSQKITELGVSKAECGKLAVEEKKEYEIVLAKRQKAKGEEAKKEKEHDDFVKRLQPDTVICSFTEQPNGQGFYEYRIYKYQTTEPGHLNFLIGEYSPDKNEIELVTKPNEPIYVSEPDLDSYFPRDSTFFGRDTCIAEANKRFKPLATKLADAGLKVGDIVCPSPANGSLYKIDDISVGGSGYARGSHVVFSPQQSASLTRVTVNKQTRQIASANDNSWLYVRAATISQFHYGIENCLKDNDEYERQKQNNSKF